MWAISRYSKAGAPIKDTFLIFHFSIIKPSWWDGFSSDQPLLKFSENEERASFIEDKEDTSMSRSKGGKGGKGKKTGKKALKGTKGLKFSKGRLALRLAGFGLQKLGASELVKFIPLSKLKQAAKKVLREKGTKQTKRRKNKKRKS